MKLVYATDFDAANIHNWSGLGVYYGRMLAQAGFDVEYLNDVKLPNPLIHYIKTHFVKQVMGKMYSTRFNISVSKSYAHTIHNKVSSGSYILSPNTVILANLKTTYKKILYADATLESLLKSYPEYSRFTKHSLKEGKIVDQQAIENSDLLIYTSQWAADSAVNDYNADPTKISIVPFGANLDFVPSGEEVKAIIAKRILSSNLKLLLLGVDWKRKGGDVAIRVAEQLNKAGINTTLHIVGIRHLPAHVKNEHVINHGYISKASPEGQAKLSSIISDSNFLILPSLADCTPVVFSEANAFGVPCLVSNVGGHSSIIKNDINGKVFSNTGFVEDSVKYILKLVESKNDYRNLCSSSYDMYLSRLNWKSIGIKISELIRSI